ELRTIYPVGVTVEELQATPGGVGPDELVELLTSDAQHAYDEREQAVGEEIMRDVERRVLLQVLDRKWREHLYEMDYLKEGIGLRAMAQREPLVEYQREGYQLFQAMMESIKEESVRFLFNAEIKTRAPEGATQEGEQDAEAGAAADGVGAPEAAPVAAGVAAGAPVVAGGLGEAVAEAARRQQALTYTGPAEDGSVTQRRADGRGPAVTPARPGANRAERRAAKRRKR